MTSYSTTLPKDLKTASGPSAWSLIKQARQQGGPLRPLIQAQQRYGDIVKLRFGRLDAHLLSHPAHAQYVLQDNNRNYVKGQRLVQSQQLLGNGLLTSEGDFWRKQRRLMQPAFHRQHIHAFGETMTSATAVMLDRWAKNSQPLDVAQEMMQLTLDIVTRTLFSAQLTSADRAQVAVLMPHLLRSTRQQVIQPLGRLRFLSNRRHAQHIAQLDHLIYRIIAERRANPIDTPDLLGLLLAAQDEESGAGMSDKQLRDEALTIFLAGHETTANLLTWAWMLLSQHPDVRQQLYQEVDTVLDGRLPTTADLPQLTYTRMVIDETLRLYPPAWMLIRTAVNDDLIDDYHIPAGTGVLVSPYLIHHHPRFWPNPEGFDPQRFAADETNKRPRYAYIPFGGGPRLCIGNNFALMEATLIMAMIAQRYKLNLIPGQRIEPETAITLRPRDGVQVTLRPRH
ncbi:MAG: cytochrome P450 [Anaerolineales bacterium]|nr:cytochrome P450 [Anaerolineales bacterium]